MANNKKFKGIAQAFIQAAKLSFIGQGADPNDIIVQDLYNYKSDNAQINNNQQIFNNSVMQGINSKLDKEQQMIISSLMEEFNYHIGTKREIIKQARSLFDMTLVQIAIDVMIDDGFNSFQNENEEFIIKYELDDDDLKNLGEEYQEQIQNEIDEFVEKFSLKTKIADIIPELLRDGEYAFGVLYDENKQKGIVDIVDDFDVIDLLPFYENEKLSFVICQKCPQDEHEDANQFGSIQFTGPGMQTMNYNNKHRLPKAAEIGMKMRKNKGKNQDMPLVYNADNLVFFRLSGPTKAKISLDKYYGPEFRKIFYEKTHIKLPKFIRISLPFYYDAIKILNRIKILTDVSSVLDLIGLLKPEIVQVSVPTNTSSVEASAIIRDFERQLNDLTGLSMDSTFDISTLAMLAYRRKVIPQWLDSKGAITSAAINQTETPANDAEDSLDKLSNQAALSMGIPPFYLNISGQPIDKAQIIKLYSRYTRKLTALQKTLSDGTKDLIMKHLQSKGLTISRQNLTVKFKALTSGDSLDDTDLLVGLVTGISDLYKALNEITMSENNNLVLDDEQFKNLFDKLTGTYLNISNLLRVDENKFENIEGEEGDMDFEPMSGPSHREHEPVTGPSMDFGSSETPSSDAYSDFVADTNDIAVSGTEPVEEEI